MATAPTVESAAPRASPHTARICCSNWLVARRVERPVAAVVWPRGELVDEQPAVADEQLDGEHADEPEVVGDAQRQTGRLGRHVGADPSRYHGEVEDAADVMVLGDRVHGRAAIGRARRRGR